MGKQKALERKITEIPFGTIAHWERRVSSSKDHVLFIHDLGSFGSSWIPENISHLDLNAYAPDLVYHGQSIATLEDGSIYDYALSLAHWAHQHRSEFSCIVAHGFGASIAIEALSQDFLQTERLFLVNPYGLQDLESYEREMIRKAGHISKWGSDNLEQHFQTLRFTTKSKGFNLEAYQIAIQKHENLAAPRFTTQMLSQAYQSLVDNRTYLKFMKLPQIKKVVFGGKNPFIPHPLTEMSLEHLVKSLDERAKLKSEVFMNSGHFPQLEFPEKFNQLLTKTLAT